MSITMSLGYRHKHKRRSDNPVGKRLLLAAAIVSCFLYLGCVLSHSSPALELVQDGNFVRHGVSVGALSKPKLRIPKHLHHVYISASWQLPDGAKIHDPAQLTQHSFPSSVEDMQTWYDLNARHGYTYHFWDRPALEALIKAQYAEYWDAWTALPKDVERADFARYIVLHHVGGTYADGDVACLRPISDLYHPSDALVASWEDAFTTTEAAIEWKYGRQAQMVNWFLAAAPRHPALRYVMDAIKRNAAVRLFADGARDTVERTGPAIWTEAVLNAAFQHQSSQENWKVRVLPKITAGWDFPAAPHAFILPPVFLRHNFRGSWQGGEPGDEEIDARHPPDYMTPLQHELLPTSVPMNPPFTLLHHMPGAGDMYEGADASYSYILFGQWQPGSTVSYPLHTVERLLDGLAAASAQQAGGPPPALVDVSAGYGLFTLAAASRGHPVLAFEAAPKSSAALLASIEHNGFPAKLVQEVLGHEAGTACLDDAETLPPTIQESRQHGYNIMAPRQGTCKQAVQRQVASDAVEEALPQGARIGAIRIAAYGWTKRVVQGLERVLQQHKPFMLVLEWRGGSVDAAHEEELALAPTLRWLAQRGWDRVLHSGLVCRKQWEEAQAGVRHRWPNGQPLDLTNAAAGECALPLEHAESSFMFMQEGQTEVLFVTRPAFE